MFNIEDKDSDLKFSSPQDYKTNCQELQENNIAWREPTADEEKKFESIIFQWKGSKRCVFGNIPVIEDKESGLKFSSPQSKNFDCNKLNENGITWRNSTDYEAELFKSIIFAWEGYKRCVNGKGLFYTDNKNGLIWSSKSKEMSWEDAVAYCKNLNEGNLSDWHLPTISELRTLIQNCPNTETGGKCGVTDSCLSYSKCMNEACYDCDYYPSKPYSKLGDGRNDYFWSSSVRSDNSGRAWYVGFDHAAVYGQCEKNCEFSVRCVRKSN